MNLLDDSLSAGTLMRCNRHQPLADIEAEPSIASDQWPNLSLESGNLILAIKTSYAKKQRRQRLLRQGVSSHASRRDCPLNRLQHRLVSWRYRHHASFGVERQLIVTSGDRPDGGAKSADFILTVQAFDPKGQRP
jgi:hypothetical protein